VNVALIIEHFDKTRGAAEHMAVWLANELAGRGHTVHVVCHDVSARINRYRQATLRASHDADQSHGAHPPTAADEPSSVNVMIEGGAIRIHTLKGMRVNTGFGLRRFGRRARRWCAANDVDVVHSLTVAYPGDVYHACAGVYAAMREQAAAASAPAKKPAAWQRVVSGLSGRERTILALERRALDGKAKGGAAEPARVISLCRMMTEQMARFYGAGRRVVELPSPRPDVNGRGEWPAERVAEERAWFRGHYRISAEDRVAVFVGHNFRRKGLRYAIEAVARTKTRWKLLVVGLGKAREYIELANRLGIGDDGREARVLFVGPTREMDRVYAAADALLLPTFYDSFGLVVMEALAWGLPVVTTEFLGAAELVRAYGAGTIVPSPQSVAEIAAALDALPRAGEPAARELAERARRAGAGVPPAAFVDALLALYADVRRG
jgi:UDP-glucose:(heptosyl)LPS alpha-1,3-glucosyltransferase